MKTHRRPAAEREDLPARSFRSRQIVVALVACCLTAHSQSVPARITYPDAITGRWEAEAGDGSWIGLNVDAATTVEAQPKTLLGVSQPLRVLTVEVYRRRWAAEISESVQDDFGWSYFRSDAQPQDIRWDGHRFLIENDGRFTHIPVHLDLAWNEQVKTWNGAFRRGSIIRQVTLRRPAHSGERSPFVGTWKASSGGCVHIAQSADGTFSMWWDQILKPGLLRYAPHLQRPTVLWEFYGQPGMVTPLDAQTLKLDFHPFAGAIVGGQLVPTFVKPGPGGSLIEAGQTPIAQRTWTREPHETCIR